MFDCIKRDPAEAKRADGGNSITQTGEYIVTITQVAVKESLGGAQYLEFALRADDGALCFPRLVIVKNDGDRAYGMGFLHALMTIIGVEEVKPVPGKVFRRDGNFSDGFRVPALEKKRVGVLLQRVNDVYNGRTKFEMNITGFFDPQTRLTASEIINGVKTPAKLDAKIKALHDRDTDDYKAFTAAPQNPAPQAADYPGANYAPEGAPDSIPF